MTLSLKLSLAAARRTNAARTVAIGAFVMALSRAWGQSAVWQPQGATTGNIYYNGGNVGIGTASPQFTLDVNGTIHLTSGLYANAIWMQGGSAIAVSSDTQNLYLGGNSNIYSYIGGTYHSVLNANGLTINNGATGASPGVGLAVASGSVGIGTTNPGIYKLAVEGTIGARDIIVTSVPWSDYVFQPGYRLRPLSEVNAYIQAHHRLPDIPSEAEVKEKGVSVGEMQSKLLAKVEELTLHMIRQETENRELRERVVQLEAGAQGNVR